MADEEKIYIRVPVSAKLLVASIMAIVIALGSYPVVNRFNPDVRHDAYTGSEGAALTDRVDTLEMEVDACQERNGNHRESQASELATLKANVERNYFLIQRCMQITEQ